MTFLNVLHSPTDALVY